MGRGVGGNGAATASDGDAATTYLGVLDSRRLLDQVLDRVLDQVFDRVFDHLRGGVRGVYDRRLGRCRVRRRRRRRVDAEVEAVAAAGNCVVGGGRGQEGQSEEEDAAHGGRGALAVGSVELTALREARIRVRRRRVPHK